MDLFLISATKMYYTLWKMKGKITMLYVTFMLRFSKTSLLKEKMSESRNLFLPLASEMERNC
jgi:steroid 5-alpha reductase family enzyme